MQRYPPRRGVEVVARGGKVQVLARGHAVEITRLRITYAGRRALAGAGPFNPAAHGPPVNLEQRGGLSLRKPSRSPTGS